ncbi:hypothetical protein I4U23_016612 [Adineta vaga]|nr:hypothetical protein I4U23_016612 [Adineta vaga]
MLPMRTLFYLILLHLVIGSPQINLDLTDWINNSKSDAVLQHDCIHVATSIQEGTDSQQIISYCMSEWPTKWIIRTNSQDRNFTFAQLIQQNITSEQLYHWSAPMDVIERYQLYLNQFPTSNEFLSMGTQLFYNCTSPRFGPLSCLDWSDICDGTVDCQNGIDEESCWPLDINTCEDNEYQCVNRQCISDIFHRDDPNTFECLDQSDESYTKFDISYRITNAPTFAYEDITCPVRQLAHDVKLTSSCVRKRYELLLRAIFVDTPKSMSHQCWSAFKCLLNVPDASNPIYMLYFPSTAIIFGHMYFIYITEDLNQFNYRTTSPQYVCYNDQLCSGFMPTETLLSLGNSTCRRLKDFPLRFNTFAITRVCSNSNMYQCINSSKCISKHRVCDSMKDCDYGDDEECGEIFKSCLGYGSNKPFKCSTGNICIYQYLVGNGICECPIDQYNLCDDEAPDKHYIRKHIYFPTICDGFTELIPVLIDGRNETDETECDYWQCNNTYTRCDGIWNCFNGADEIDCLGAFDEPKLCRKNNYQPNDEKFHCTNHINDSCVSLSKLCIESKCENNTDKQFCDSNRTETDIDSFCDQKYQSIRSDVENFVCNHLDDTNKPEILHFSLNEKTDLSKTKTQQSTDIIITHSSILPTTRQYQQYCHRGLALHVWLDSEKNISEITCLCPPSFYGNMCQYQNQRVSLTIQFRAFSDSLRTLFSLVILLIDESNERIIHSYHQFTYLYIRDCQKKFNMYLLYSTRPINQKIKYAIHIDIYEAISLKYRGSLLIPLTFTFLPVYRVAVLLDIPRIQNSIEDCSKQRCIHGRCIQYSTNSENDIFCQCNQGWSGQYCNIQQINICQCSYGSLCIGIAANNRSICICPLNKWGSHCSLQNTICQINQTIICQNEGQCIPTNEYTISEKKFICICLKGFSGERCEISDTIITVLFDKDIVLPQSIFFHFIRQIDHTAPENGSTFKSIITNQRSVTVKWSRPFHVVFVELPDKTFHLITIQKIYNQSTTIIQTISLLNRCRHTRQLFNETIIKYHLLRRIKYYHLPCQIHSPQLTCFYDDIHFCLCTNFSRQRIANCFEFNHTIKHDCFGKSNCENEGQSLQDKAICPQTSICVCRACFHGVRCQFSSHLFGLSLDAVLGYHIQPHIDIRYQPSIVQISVAITILLILLQSLIFQQAITIQELNFANNDDLAIKLVYCEWRRDTHTYHLEGVGEGVGKEKIL